MGHFHVPAEWLGEVSPRYQYSIFQSVLENGSDMGPNPGQKHTLQYQGCGSGRIRFIFRAPFY